MVLLRSVAWRHVYRNVYRLITRTDPNREFSPPYPSAQIKCYSYRF